MIILCIGGGGAAQQIACKLMNLIKVSSSSKNGTFAFFHSVPSQLILKYAYTLDVLIHHIVHMTQFDYTLPILQNFEKTKCAKSTSMKFNQVPV